MKHSSIYIPFKLTSQISHNHTLLACFSSLSSLFCVLFAETWKGAVPQFLKMNVLLSKKRGGNEVCALVGETREAACAMEIVGDVFNNTWLIFTSLPRNFGSSILLDLKYVD